MMNIRLVLAVLAAAVLTAAACGGRGEGGVRLEWDSESDVAAIAGEGGRSPEALQTTVYVTNDTGGVIRDAVVRLSDEAAELEMGLSIGTATAVSTRFDGPTRTWSLGDLQPGKRYALNLGLWFSSRFLSAAPEKLVLAVELTSPDLGAPLRSNELALTLVK